MHNFYMKMLLFGRCTIFSKVTLVSLPEMFCGPQICQNALAAGALPLTHWGSSRHSPRGLAISVNWTFSLCVTAEALRANIGSKLAILLQRGLVDPKCQVEGVAPINYSSSRKTRLNEFSYGIKIWTDFSFTLSQSTRLTNVRHLSHD